MPTRKQLIDQARADQRARSARARADNPKSAIVGIGDRDPLTGQYQVLLPNGSVEMGEKQFNSSLPKGSQVLGVPQSTGGWLLDERDVQPIKPISTSPMGKIKVLYSVIEGDQRVLYLWGDRPRPKRIASIPLLDVYVNAFQYFVSNQGVGNKYVVSLLRQDLGEYVQGTLNVYSGRVHVQSFGSQVCEYILPLRNTTYSYFDRYLGHGFWSGDQVFTTSYIGSYSPVGAVFHPSSYTLYQGVTTNYQGNLSFTYQADQFGAQYINSQTFTLPEGISPSIVKTSVGYSQDMGSAATGYGTSFTPLLLSQNAQSAIYLETTLLNFRSTAQYKFVTPTSEVVLGGDIRPLPTDANLIGSHLYQVIIPNNYNDSQWSVSIYELGTNTTKKTIKAKVQYKHSPNYQIYSASYHP